MGVVDEAVENGVGMDDLMPFVERDLAGQDG